MKIELKIANQYLISNRRKGFVSFISGFSIVGIILAITALITTLSVMNGFHDDIRNRILNTMHHGYITTEYNKINDWEKEITKINSHSQIINSTPYVENFALITSAKASNGVLIRGILEQTETNDNEKLTNNIKYGELDLPDNKQTIIIGIGLFNSLKTAIGEYVTVIVPVRENDILIPTLHTFEVVGIFDSGLNQYNNSLAFINLYNAQKLFNMDNSISGIKIEVDDIFNADKIIADAASKTSIQDYIAIDWMQENVNFINAINLERKMVRIILFLIITIAIFNIVSIVFITVKSKRIDIAILRTIGMTPKRIVTIFIYQGIIIGLIGIIIGICCGLLVAYNIQDIVYFIENLFNFKLLPGNSFYANTLPSSVKLIDVLNIALGSFILVIFASIYPATKAGKVQIAEVFRYE